MMSEKGFLLRTPDMGLDLPLVKSMHLNFQAYCNMALEALMELRSQDSVFLRTAGALPSTSSREGLTTLRPRKGVAVGSSSISSPFLLTVHRRQEMARRQLQATHLQSIFSLRYNIPLFLAVY